MLKESHINRYFSAIKTLAAVLIVVGWFLLMLGAPALFWGDITFLEEPFFFWILFIGGLLMITGLLIWINGALEKQTHYLLTNGKRTRGDDN